MPAFNPLNVQGTLESYGATYNPMQQQAAATAIKSRQLDNSAKAAEMSKTALSNVQSADELGKWVDWSVNQLKAPSIYFEKAKEIADSGDDEKARKYVELTMMSDKEKQALRESEKRIRAGNPVDYVDENTGAELGTYTADELDAAMKLGALKNANPIPKNGWKHQQIQAQLKDLLGEGEKEKNLGASVNAFEATAPLSKEAKQKYPKANSYKDIRKTKIYQDAYKKYIADTGGSSIVGTDENGNPIIYQSKGGGGIKKIQGPEGGIRPKTLKQLPSEAVDKISNQRDLIKQIGRIRTMAKEMPDKIGPLEGRWNAAKRLFIEDPKSERLAREVNSLITIAYSLSGKQISEGELKMLQQAILPKLSQPDANFMAALDYAQAWVQGKLDTGIETYKQSGYVVPEAKTSSRKEELKAKYGLE